MTSKRRSAKECRDVHDLQAEGDVALSPEVCSPSQGITTLKELCEQRWREIKLSAQKLSNTNVRAVDADKSLLQILQEKEKCVQAEIKILKTSKADRLPPDPNVQFEVLKQDLLSSIEQLEETLSLAGSQEQELKNSIEKEQEYERQLLTVNHHLEEKVESFDDGPMSNTRDPLSAVFKELQAKIKKVELVDKQLSKDFDTFLTQHFPLPTENDLKVYKKTLRRTNSGNGAHNLLTLKTILEELMNKCIDEPHDPYITLTDWYWSPYIELLTRCQIVLHHPDHDNKIKLVPFHL
ncbi:centromere protein K-like [Gigantopelta aegis]|uniref:centromere protein K-like n=1 Tax=Gigantopelta aegis TaxID=1735272 RepID=UPI001B88C03B|nr:centromere protein K-like [Gigantopelta aegis]